MNIYMDRLYILGAHGAEGHLNERMNRGLKGQ